MLPISRSLGPKRLARACRAGVGAAWAVLRGVRADASPAQPWPAPDARLEPAVPSGLESERSATTSLGRRLDSVERRLDSLVAQLTASESAKPTVEKTQSAERHTQRPTEPATLSEGLSPSVANSLKAPRVPREFRTAATTPVTENGQSGRVRVQPAPLISGTVSGLSLTSLFSLFEFERLSGVLSLSKGSRGLELTLQDGSVTRAEADGTRIAASAAVGEVFAWQSCGFAFRCSSARQEEEEAPQSANALMLEALRRRDEQQRTG